ncbi:MULTISPECIES: thioredoxin family protein [Bacillus]|uniref:thioredoxin family protein n=1 Tax=Bacillus TaxID=1386 RepID=UPI0002E258A1|nr:MULTISPECIES: thioredoxin family protein [Bacillus]
MKKVIIFLIVIIALFVGIALITNTQNSQKVKDNPYGKDDLHQETIDQLDDKNYQYVITPENLEKKLNNEKETIVYFYSPTCHYCKEATPKVLAAAKKLDIDVNQYNLYEFENGWDDYGIENTPTLVVYENGKEKDRIVGDTDQKVFEDFFKKNQQ